MLKSRVMQPDLWVVTTYFNSESYASRRRNYDRFIHSLERGGVPYQVVECAFGERPFDLPYSSQVIQRRSPAVLWQKERLLNSALSQLPESCSKVAWVDADVLFENPKWHLEASELLNRFPVVQLFDSVVRLPRGHTEFRGVGDASTGFAAECSRSPGCERDGWFSHGHTGFAWAAQRGFLERCGLFDVCLSGSADHLMAHAFLGDFESRCIDHLIGLAGPTYRAYVSWARTAFGETRGNVGYLRGAIYHLWHGDLEQRRYHEHSQELKFLGFDPHSDVELTPEGCWNWTGRNLKLQQWARELFADRREDG